eukprot:403333417
MEKESLNGLPRIKQVKYGTFKLNQDKEQENIKKFLSPIKVLPPPDEEQSTNVYQSSDYMNNDVRGISQLRPHIMINQSSSRNLLTQRSQSVSAAAKNTSRLSKIQRFFDFEQERSKSRISRLLNEPIKVPNLDQSSFISDNASKRKSTIQQPKLLLNQSDVTQVKGDFYIGDDEDERHNKFSKSELSVSHKNVETSLPRIINSRNMQNLSMLSQNYYNNNLTSQSSLGISNINKQSQTTILKQISSSKFSSRSNLKIKPNSSSRLNLKPQSPKSQMSPTEQKDHILSRDISKEQNAFKRQKMLFQLIDQAKDRNMSERSMEALFNKKNLLQNAKSSSKPTLTPSMKKSFSALKTVKLDSSIIQAIDPTFPLQKDVNMFQQIQMENDQELKIKISDIVSLKQPLKTLVNGVQGDIERVFDLEQAIYRNKMEGMNEIMDQKLDDVKLKYLDEEYIYKKFKEQLEEKSKIKGKKLTNIKKYSRFDDQNWPKITDLFDHQGNQISKSGLKMDEEQAQKEQQEELKKKMQMLKLQKSRTKTTRQMENSGTTNSPDAQSLRKRGISDIDQSLNDHTSNFNDEDSSDNENENNTIGATTQNHSPITKRLKDQEFLTELKNLELKDLVVQQKQMQNKIKKLELHRSRVSRKQIEQIKIKLEKIQQEQQARIKQLKDEMTQEEEEYWEEQNLLRQQEMLGNIDVFLDEKKNEIQNIGTEIFEMENDSDDEFGIFQNFSNTQAHMVAKQKVIAKERQRQRNKDTQKMLITIKGKKDVMKSIVKGLHNVQEQRDQKIMNFDNNQEQNANAIQNTFGETKMMMNDRQIKEADQNSGFQKVMQQAQKKQDFGKLIQEVYEKNENIEYVKKKKKKAPHKQLEDQEDDDYSQDAYDSDSSVSQKSEIVVDYTRDMLDKEEIYEQQQLEIKIQEEAQANMARKYLQYCKNEQVLPLPILSKIEDGVLSLDDYKLNFGLCKALGSVLEDLGGLIRKLVLKNNGINDKSYSILLEGALRNRNIKSLHLKGNEFQEDSLQQYLDYFKREKRPWIEEIVISNCKQKLSQTNKLLKRLADYSGLKVLALCQSKLDKESCLLLADVANGNPNLRELDLAWNEVTSLNMWELIQNLEFCKHISFLNLSFNSFAGQRTADIVQSLSNFIRRNRNLQHLDISYCGLRKDEVLDVVKACKKSRSLLAVHLSGNIISDETKKKIREYMRPRKRVKDIYDQINNPDEDVDKSDIPRQVSNFNIDLAAAIKEKLSKYQKRDAENIKQDKGESNAMKGTPGERLIFSRILGHFEIPKSYKWHESSECWICEKHRYTVIVASNSIAQACFKKPVSEKEKTLFTQKIKDAKNKREEAIINDEEHWGSDEDNIYYEADTEDQKSMAFMNNQISSTFSKWQLKSMLPFKEFLRRLNQNQKHNVTYVNMEKSQYEKMIVEMRLLKEQKNKQKLVRSKEISQNYRKMLKFDDSEESTWFDKIREGDLLPSNWLKEMEQKLTYKSKTNMAVSFDKIIESTIENKKFLDGREKVYIYAQYLPPGKHNTCLVYNTSNVPKKDIYTFYTIVKPREDIIPINHKKVKEFKIERIFDKPNSMFKDYIEDNPQNLKKAFEKDLENSKIPRFIKDILEFRSVCEVLVEYTEYIKDLFTYSIALSSYPSISWIDFTNLCQEWQIPDNRTCTMQTIDRVFIATNVELIEQEDNPDRDLCRFEFYEIIVRMGGAKYKDSGHVSTWDASTRKIIENNLKPNSQFMTGQKFRNQYVWTLPIDDLFRANNELVLKLYNKFTNLGKKWIELDDCLAIMAPLQISEYSLKQCFAFSKMSIIDEMNQKEKYERMTISEFFDFIVRCAYIKYKDESHLSMVEKTERVLDVLFKEINCRRKRPNYEIEVSSESDYESDD